MLAWEVYVCRQVTIAAGGEPKEILVATWTTAVNGLRWLDDLVKANKAVFLGGDGYPLRYTVAAGVLLPLISNGLPPNDSPIVFGEDYILPRGWSSKLDIDLASIADCRSEETLFIEAWDQS